MRPSATMDPEDSWQQHAADTSRRATTSPNPTPSRSSPRAPHWASTTWSATAWLSPGRKTAAFPSASSARTHSAAPPSPVTTPAWRSSAPGQPRQPVGHPHARQRLHHPASWCTTVTVFGAYGFDINTGRATSSTPTPSSWRRAATPVSGAARPRGATRTPETRSAWRWRPAPVCATPSWCSSTPRESSSPRTRPAPWSARRPAVRAASCATPSVSASWPATTPSAWNFPRATAWPWPPTRRSRKAAARQGRRLARRLPPAARNHHGPAAAGLPDAAGTADARHHPRSDRDRADRALLDGRGVGQARRTTAPTSTASTQSARPPAACTAPIASAATASSSCWSSAASRDRPQPSTPRR